MGDMADDYSEYTDLFGNEHIVYHSKKKRPYLEIEVKKIIAATQKAFLCRLDDDEEYWIPFSQIRDYDEFEPGDTECVLHITEWINDRLTPIEKKSIFDQKARGGADE